MPKVTFAWCLKWESPALLSQDEDGQHSVVQSVFS